MCVCFFVFFPVCLSSCLYEALESHLRFVYIVLLSVLTPRDIIALKALYSLARSALRLLSSHQLCLHSILMSVFAVLMH